MRIYLYIFIAVVLGVLVWRLSVWHAAYQTLGKERQEWVAKENGYLAAQMLFNEVSKDYETKISDLNKTVPVLTAAVGPVRLCKPTPSVHPRTDTSGPNAALSEELPPKDAENPDIGPELFSLANDAETCAIRLSSLQSLLNQMMETGVCTTNSEK